MYNTDKIIIGIDQSSDIDSLLNDGIKQFYFGYIDENFIKKYSTQISPNRRYRLKEQFTSQDIAFSVIEKIHKKNGKVYLALNAFFSNQTLQAYSKDIYNIFSNKVDGIIVANISMALMLKNLGYKNIVTSNLFGVYSTPAVEFLQNLCHPIKIILPRDISLENIQKIVTAFPKQEFEVFLFGDNCRYSESFCFSEHGYDSIGFGSLCSFALQNKLPIKAPTPSFRQIALDGKLTLKEKKELLQKEHIDIFSLLDKLILLDSQTKSKEIVNILDILLRYDIQNFYTSKDIYTKSIFVLKALSNNYEKAKQLLEKLKEKEYKEQDSYLSFHKLNSAAIQKTIEFFSKFDNITSYKIPSRGRELYRYLQNQQNSTYNYKESQYRL